MSETCVIDITTKCTVDHDDSDCASYSLPATECTEAPFALMFRYHGGPCNLPNAPESQHFSQSLVECHDFNGGPPTNAGWKVYITSMAENGAIIFSDYVAVGSDFSIASKFENTTTIKVYSSEETAQENLLQSITFTSDCSAGLYLNDNVGPAQLILFANNAQGVVSCFIGAKYTFNVENIGSGTNTTLTGLNLVSSVGTFNLQDIAKDLVLEPRKNAYFQQEILLDMSSRHRYTSLSTITARSSEGYTCSDKDFLTFLINGPSVSPDNGDSSASSHNPDADKCRLNVETKCITVGERENTCDNIEPRTDQCQDRPTALMFRYNGGRCTLSAPLLTDTDAESSIIQCVDNDTGGPPVVEGEMSYIIVSDFVDETKIYHSASVPVGGEFLVPFGLQGAPKAMQIRIFSSTDDVPQGTLLQSIALLSDCSSSDKRINLQDRFGSVQLLVVANKAQGVLTNFVNATFSFLVTNVDPTNIVVLTQSSSVTTLGVVHAAKSAIGTSIHPKASTEYRHEFVVDATIRQRYTSLTIATAETAGGYTCEGKDLMTFVVGGSSQIEATPGNETTGSSAVAPSGAPGSDYASPSNTTQQGSSSIQPEPTPSNDTNNAPSPSMSFALENPTEKSDSPTSPPLSSSGASVNQDCLVEFDVKCVAADGLGDCSSIVPETPKCLDRPTGMLFRYHGGACSLPSTTSSKSFVECVDYNGGPSATLGETVYIKIGDIDDFELVYYEAEIAVGDSFMLHAPAGGMAAESMILVYSSSDASRSNLLQSIYFLSDCHVELSLEDKLGSVQLIGYENGVQGNVTSLVNAIYEFTIRNPGNDGNVILSSLSSITNLGAIEVPINDSILTPNTTISFQREVTIDATELRRYTALSTLTGTSADGSKCSLKHLFSFVVKGFEGTETK